MKRLRAVTALLVLAGTAAACAPSTPPPPPKPVVLVVGDSNAIHLAIALQAANTGWNVINGAKGGCNISPEGTGTAGQTYQKPTLVDYKNEYWSPTDTPVEGDCKNWIQLFTDYTKKYKPRVVVFSVGGWEITDRWFPSECPGWPSTANCPQPASIATDETARNHFLAALNQAMHIFGERGARVVIAEQPYLNPSVPQNQPSPGDPVYAQAFYNIWWEPYSDNNAAPANWDPDAVNGVKPVWHNSKTEMQVLHQLQEQWVNTPEWNKASTTSQAIVRPQGLVDLDVMFSPGDAYAKWICYGSGQAEAAIVNGSSVTCPLDGDPAYDVREADGVHFSVVGRNIAAQMLIPAIQASM